MHCGAFQFQQSQIFQKEISWFTASSVQATMSGQTDFRQFNYVATLRCLLQVRTSETEFLQAILNIRDIHK
jgi:hypothetical protein